MGGSLQDQLIKPGLSNNKQAKQINQVKRKKQKQKRHGVNKEDDVQAQARQQALDEKLKKDRELNRQRQLEAQRRATDAQIAQLISEHRVPRQEGDVAFNFADDKKVKRIYINAEQQKSLSQGRLAIVTNADRYEFVPSDILDKIRQRDASRIVFWVDKQVDQEDTEDEEYPPIPDDLMW